MTITEKIAIKTYDAFQNMKQVAEMPITADDTFDYISKTIYDRFYKAEKHREEMDRATLASERTVLYCTIGKWLLSKAVYRFHKDFFAALCETEDTPMKTEMLRRLPHQSFYISLEQENLKGYFVYIEPHENGDCLLSTVPIFDIEEHKGICYKEFSLWFKDGMTVSEAVDKLMKDLDVNPDLYGPKEAYIKAISGYQKPLKESLLAAYYLAAQNAEIKPVKSKKENRPKRSNGKPMNLRSWDVGYRVGQSFSKIYSDSPAEIDTPVGHPSENRKSIRPHVRRAHWHHYWKGKGRTELTLLWVAPAYVNHTAGDIIPVEHKIEEGG